MKKIFIFTTLILFILYPGWFLAQIPSSGLTAYYPMGASYSEGSPIASHKDLSEYGSINYGYTFDLTVSNGYGYGEGRTGKAEEAAEFNGSENDLRRFNYASVPEFTSGFSFTLSAWVRLDGSNENTYQYIVQVGGGDQIYLRFYKNAGNYSIQGGYKGVSPQWVQLQSNINTIDYVDKWKFITLLKNGNNLELRVDNVVLATISNPYSVSFSEPHTFFTVGNSLTPGGAFKGRIQDVSYYHYPKNNTELGKLFCSVSTPENTTTDVYQGICSGSSVELTAETTPVSNTIKWYSNKYDGTAISTGDALTLSSVTNSSIYYIDATSGSGCVSYPRIPIEVTVISEPINTTTSDNQTICIGTPTVLSVSGAGDFYWYDTPTGGTALGSGSTFTTPSITSNTSFYVEAVEPNTGSCNSARIEIPVTLRPATTTPVTSASHSVCQGNGTVLEVDYVNHDETVNFWNSPTLSDVSNHLGVGYLYSVPSSNLTSTTSFWVDVYNSTTGCYSERVEIVVTVKETNTGVDTQSACGSYTWINGTTYTSSTNTPTYTLTNVTECDSVVTLNLTIIEVNDAVTITGSTLTATQNGATYQWIDCDNGSTPIAGETNQSFTPAISGSYAVEVTVNGCTETSACTLTNVVGIEETIFNNVILYPNPASTSVTIENIPAESVIMIFDVTGKSVYSATSSNSIVNINTDVFENGIYHIQIENNGSITNKKLIINKQ